MTRKAPLFALQPLIFEDQNGNGELYQRGKCRILNGALIIPAGETVRLDTYFNLFPVRQWAEWTAIQAFTVSIEVQGSGTVSLYGLDESNTETLISRKEFKDIPEQTVPQSPGPTQTIRVIENCPVRDLPAFCFLEIRAEKEITVIKGGLCTDQAPRRDLNIACCFCTYKREKEIVRNVRNLMTGIIRNRNSVLSGRLEIYIADNGHTLSPVDFEAEDQTAAEMSPDVIHLFENPNYGGSAGFTRCLIEAKFGQQKKHYTHFILMDDDALIQPYVVERTACLLSYLKEEYKEAAVGGAMLSQQATWMQLENGAKWIIKKPEIRGYDTDLRNREILINNQRGKVDYNGWFYACIPTGFITDTNLPYPFFIHGDDINYGLRNRNGWIHMNGICIWHPNPQIARRPHMLYYDSRNYKIVNNEYLPRMKAMHVAWNELIKNISLACQYRYEDCYYELRGTRDYLKGYDWFVRQNPEELNRDLMKWKKYEECRFDPEKIAFQDATEIKQRKLKTVLAWFVPATKSDPFYNSEAGWDKIRMFRTKQYYLIDQKTGKGFAFRKSYRKLFGILGSTIHLSVRILINYSYRSEDWKKHMAEMKKMDFWQSYLG